MGEAWEALLEILAFQRQVKSCHATPSILGRAFIYPICRRRYLVRGVVSRESQAQAQAFRTVLVSVSLPQICIHAETATGVIIDNSAVHPRCVLGDWGNLRERVMTKQRQQECLRVQQCAPRIQTSHGSGLPVERVPGEESELESNVMESFLSVLQIPSP